MKKILALILCLCLFFSLAGCKDNNGGSDSSSNGTTSTVKIKNDLKEGRIPELPFALGCSVSDAQDILNALEKLPEGVEVEEGYTYYSTKVSGDAVRLSCEGNFYYYNTSKSSKGISAIATFGDAYGFKIGIDMLSDITEAIRQEGTIYSPKADDLYFIFGQPETDKYQAVYYTAGDFRVDFVFYDSYLSATLISNTANWDPADMK